MQINFVLRTFNNNSLFLNIFIAEYIVATTAVRDSVTYSGYVSDRNCKGIVVAKGRNKTSFFYSAFLLNEGKVFHIYKDYIVAFQT